MKKIQLAGSITVFIMILVGLIIGFYMMGYRSPMMSVIESNVITGEDTEQPEMTPGGVIQLIIDGIVDNWWLFGFILGVAVLTSAISGGSTIISFIGLFLPIFILLAMANLLFFPVLTDVQATGFTIGPLGVVIALVLNVLLMLTVIEFISGRN